MGEKGNLNVIKRCCRGAKRTIAIAIARFNNFINDSLLEGAVDAL